jgi:hypothetical protein
MLDDKSLLELALHVSGGFENGQGASYNSLTGNFDGQGMSAGILQWNAGQGTLQQLVKNIAANMGGWDKPQTFFSSSIQQFASTNGSDGIAWCLNHYIVSGGKDVDPAAKVRWQNFLIQPESVAAQVAMASAGILGHAKREVAAYAPDYVANNRPYVFFFDLIVQEGGMSVHGHTVPPIPAGTTPDTSDVLAFAEANDPKCADIWEDVITGGDNEAALLTHYAYARAQLANPQFQWDACVRRGTIACRQGIVHQAHLDFTTVLD